MIRVLGIDKDVSTAILLLLAIGVYYVETVGRLFGRECRIVVLLDPDRRNRSRVERDLLLQALESETDRRKIAEMKKA